MLAQNEFCYILTNIDKNANGAMTECNQQYELIERCLLIIYYLSTS